MPLPEIDLKTLAAANAFAKSLFSSIYPVGSIYISVSSASPATWFGGTWERIQDKFLLAAGSTYAAGATGGEATHTLTLGEIPSHSHTLSAKAGSGSGSVYGLLDRMGDNLNPLYTDSKGSGQAHNNMPPYLAVYVWKRTA